MCVCVKEERKVYECYSLPLQEFLDIFTSLEILPQHCLVSLPSSLLPPFLPPSPLPPLLPTMFVALTPPPQMIYFLRDVESLQDGSSQVSYPCIISPSMYCKPTPYLTRHCRALHVT